MDPVTFSQLLQVLTLLVTATSGVVVLWLQLRIAKTVKETSNAVNGFTGAALAGKAAAFTALAELDPTPATQAAATAAEEEKTRHDATKPPGPPK